MFDFSQITEVRLARGEHSAPTQGMCFMEMVAWFNGERHSDRPECACPVLGRYGITLNDRMPDNLRDTLLKPMVPLIAGTRCTLDDQRQRAEFLTMWVVNKALPVTLRLCGEETLALACEMARTLAEARQAVGGAYGAYGAADAAAYAADAAANAAAYAAADAAANAAAYAADGAADAAANAAAYAADGAADAAADGGEETRETIFRIAVEGLRQAILIGPHEGLSAMCDPAERHAALREMLCA